MIPTLEVRPNGPTTPFFSVTPEMMSCATVVEAVVRFTSKCRLTGDQGAVN